MVTKTCLEDSRTKAAIKRELSADSAEPRTVIRHEPSYAEFNSSLSQAMLELEANQDKPVPSIECGLPSATKEKFTELKFVEAHEGMSIVTTRITTESVSPSTTKKMEETVTIKLDAFVPKKKVIGMLRFKSFSGQWCPLSTTIAGLTCGKNTGILNSPRWPIWVKHLANLLKVNIRSIFDGNVNLHAEKKGNWHAAHVEVKLATFMVAVMMDMTRIGWHIEDMDKVTIRDLHQAKNVAWVSEKPVFEILLSRAPCMVCRTFVERIKLNIGFDVSIKVHSVGSVIHAQKLVRPLADIDTMKRKRPLLNSESPEAKKQRLENKNMEILNDARCIAGMDKNDNIGFTNNDLVELALPDVKIGPGGDEDDDAEAIIETQERREELRKQNFEPAEFPDLSYWSGLKSAECCSVNIDEIKQLADFKTAMEDKPLLRGKHQLAGGYASPMNHNGNYSLSSQIQDLRRVTEATDLKYDPIDRDRDHLSHESHGKSMSLCQVQPPGISPMLIQSPLNGTE
ncbi:hypothetical protein CFIMG_008487RA00001 [Ceratocystis fimbriata CBS 114723]|uniref:Uncharacterized protein n=1 Tax=Ceratocystis fimbriata CBS 114723 TaxID=1035309 RepID=A0A2C5X2C8_9PEZI|nr:hypothetical protein CFIMG_008487RA00001 [Ceratocystis fimbriata CBS 114723]